MNELIRDTSTEIAEINQESDTNALLSKLQHYLSISVHSVRMVAAIIKRLEELGTDVIGLEIPNLSYFRKIAYGQLSPELFVSMAERPGFIKKLQALPLPDQEKIAHDTKQKVLLSGGDHLMVAVKDMTKDQFDQVFSTNGVRSESQQAACIADKKQKACARSAERPEIVVDRKKHGIYVSDVFISAADLADLVGTLLNDLRDRGLVRF